MRMAGFARGGPTMVAMIKFKSCPKCRGDLSLGQDIFGKYLSCLQCGYLKDIPDERAADRELVAAEGDPIPA